MSRFITHRRDALAVLGSAVARCSRPAAGRRGGESTGPEAPAAGVGDDRRHDPRDLEGRVRRTGGPGPSSSSRATATPRRLRSPTSSWRPVAVISRTCACVSFAARLQHRQRRPRQRRPGADQLARLRQRGPRRPRRGRPPRRDPHLRPHRDLGTHHAWQREDHEPAPARRQGHRHQGGASLRGLGDARQGGGESRLAATRPGLVRPGDHRPGPHHGSAGLQVERDPRAQRARLQVQGLGPDEYGVAASFASLVVNTDFAAAHPRAVAGFLRADVAGFWWAYRHQDQAVAYCDSSSPRSSPSRARSGGSAGGSSPASSCTVRRPASRSARSTSASSGRSTRRTCGSTWSPPA